jgi:outer membrane protein, heavy metal efflux system
MKKLVVAIAGCVFAATAIAQSGVDSVIDAVRRNNAAIRTNTKYWEARQQEYKTGLTPYDPQVEYDYMFGSPAAAGNQRDFSVTQRLDFPTAYGRKRELGRRQEAQIENHRRMFSQQILLDAKLVALDIIYLNKRGAELGRRLLSTTQLLKDYQRKLDLGDAIILDVNKARVQRLNIQSDLALNENERALLITRLTEFNGGIAIDLRDTIYPVHPGVPSFEVLDSIIEANDPELKVYASEQEVMRQQIAVQRSMNLPKIEAGYHSQGILGQSYRGFHTGITIPLWENRNRLKSAQANLEYVISNTATRRLEHRLENRRVYERLEVRRATMAEYHQLLPSLNNTTLLNKALRLGQITVIQYFQDESFYFSSYDRYLQVEREYHKAIAQLYKFAL